jgi:hypothetical protein
LKFTDEGRLELSQIYRLKQFIFELPAEYTGDDWYPMALVPPEIATYPKDTEIWFETSGKMTMTTDLLYRAPNGSAQYLKSGQTRTHLQGQKITLINSATLTWVNSGS